MAKLEVSHRTINFNHRILNLRTVTSIAKLHGTRARAVPLTKVAFAFVVFCVSILLLRKEETQTVGGILSLCTILYLVSAYVRDKNRDLWALHVETAAASDNLLVSKEEKPIDDAVRLITTALESDVAFHNELHISDSMIVNDATITNSSLANTSNKSKGAGA